MRRHEKGLQLLEGLKRNESEYNSGSPNDSDTENSKSNNTHDLNYARNSGKAGNSTNNNTTNTNTDETNGENENANDRDSMQQKGTAPLIAPLSSGGAMSNRKKHLKE